MDSPHTARRTTVWMCVSVSTTHRLLTQVRQQTAVVEVCQKQSCQSTLPLLVSEVSPSPPPSSIYSPSPALCLSIAIPLWLLHTQSSLCGHLSFSILSPPFLLFIQSLVCHTLTTSFTSSSLSIHNHCYSFDFSSLTLLISIWAPSFSLSVSPYVSLPLSCWGGLDGRWVIAAFATLQMIYLPQGSRAGRDGGVCKSERRGESSERWRERGTIEGEGKLGEPTCWHRTLSNGGKQSLSTVKKNAPDKYLIHQSTPDVLMN